MSTEIIVTISYPDTIDEEGGMEIATFQSTSWENTWIDLTDKFFGLLQQQGFCFRKDRIMEAVVEVASNQPSPSNNTEAGYE